MLILGLDPGSLCTGYGLIAVEPGRARYLRSGCLRPRRGRDLPQRLLFLHAALRALLDEVRPDAAAVEQAFVGEHARPALVLGHARGALIVGILAAGVPLFEYAPRLVKLAVTGAGGASKPRVQTMVSLLLEGAPRELAADEADALAVALCHAHRAQPLVRPGTPAERSLGVRG
jgi:crossover junction endodeoxyribonuclease RuvC